MVNDRPEEAYAYYGRGIAKFSLGEAEDNKSAIKDFDRAIQINPNFALAYLSRSVSKLTLLNFRAAIEDSNMACSHSPVRSINLY